MSRTPASTSSRPAAPSTAGSRPARSASTHTERDERMRDADRVDELGLEREQEPTRRRAGDERELKRDGALRERADQDLPGHERRRQRAARGRSDRAGDARREREREERPHLVGTGQRDRKGRPSDADLDDDHESVEEPARDAIRELARRQREQWERKELREPDEPEVERVSRTA